jgi:hypothetical protein
MKNEAPNIVIDWILRHKIWVKVLAPTLMSLCSIYRNYDATFLEEKHHPIQRYLLSNWVIPTLPWVLALSIIIYITVLIIEVRSQPRIDKLTKKLTEATEKNNIISERLRDFFDGYLYNLASKLGFGSQGANCERITLYIHDQGNNFIQCGRYSANPKFRGVNRTRYPDNEGCIAKGWENGWHFDSELPCPVNNLSNYIDYCLREYNVPRNTTRRIKMKSRLYAVSCIEKNGISLAVIVVESETENRFQSDKIRELLSAQNEFLGHAIGELRDYIPKPSTAMSAGL